VIVIIPGENVVSKNPKALEREREFLKVYIFKSGGRKKIFEIKTTTSSLFLFLKNEKRRGDVCCKREIKIQMKTHRNASLEPSNSRTCGSRA